MAGIAAFGRYLPEKVVTNQELAARFGCEAAWIEQVSGIRERRVAERESVVDLGIAAGQACLGAERPGVGLVLVSSATAERRFPGPAAAIAKGLGLAGVPAIDLPIASAGGLFAISLAASLVEKFESVLVVASEKMHGEARGQNTAILFGDGAGACLVTREHHMFRIATTVLHSDAEGGEALHLPLNSALEMNGMAVIRQASAKLPAVIGEALAEAGIQACDVGQFILHQANQNLMDRVARSLGVPAERFFSNIARYGNTSSASLLIAADEWVRSAHGGGPVCLAAFGAGFHWGAAVLSPG